MKYRDKRKRLSWKLVAGIESHFRLLFEFTFELKTSVLRHALWLWDGTFLQPLLLQPPTGWLSVGHFCTILHIYLGSRKNTRTRGLFLFDRIMHRVSPRHSKLHQQPLVFFLTIKHPPLTHGISLRHGAAEITHKCLSTNM